MSWRKCELLTLFAEGKKPQEALNLESLKQEPP